MSLYAILFLILRLYHPIPCTSDQIVSLPYHGQPRKVSKRSAVVCSFLVFLCVLIVIQFIQGWSVSLVPSSTILIHKLYEIYLTFQAFCYIYTCYYLKVRCVSVIHYFIYYFIINLLF